MCIFNKVREYINNLECGSTFTYEDIYDKIVDQKKYSDGETSLLKLYLATFEKIKALEVGEEGPTIYTIKRKLVKDLSLYNFFEVVNGGNFKEWFIQVCEP